MEKRTNGTIEELSLLLKAYHHNTIETTFAIPKLFTIKSFHVWLWN
jgi:hypothetical protein